MKYNNLEFLNKLKLPTIICDTEHTVIEKSEQTRLLFDKPEIGESIDDYIEVVDSQSIRLSTMRHPDGNRKVLYFRSETEANEYLVITILSDRPESSALQISEGISRELDRMLANSTSILPKLLQADEDGINDYLIFINNLSRAIRSLSLGVSTHLSEKRTPISVDSFSSLLSELCDSILPAFGCELSCNNSTHNTVLLNESEQLSIFLCSVIFSVIVLSSDGRLNIDFSGIDSEHTKIEISSGTDALYKNLSINDLALMLSDNSQSFGIDLLIANEIASQNNWASSALCEGGVIKVSVTVDSSEYSQSVEMNSGEDHILAELLPMFAKGLISYSGFFTQM